MALFQAIEVISYDVCLSKIALFKQSNFFILKFVTNRIACTQTFKIELKNFVKKSKN